MDGINILVTINRAFMHQLKAMLHSLFINNAESSIDIYLLHTELTQTDLSLIEGLINRRGGRFFPYHIDNETARVLSVSRFFPPEVFYRLLCASYIPEHVEKILYLDSDIIINGSIAGLYNKIMCLKNECGNDIGYLFAAAPDYINMYSDSSEYKSIMERTGLLPSQPYVNSGVLLINLKLYRSCVTITQIIEAVKRHRNSLVYPDQDLLNLLFSKSIMYLNIKLYNYNPINFRNFTDILPNDPVIIHFNGAFRPWGVGYPQDTPVLAKAKSLYEKYAAMDF